MEVQKKNTPNVIKSKKEQGGIRRAAF